MLEKCVWTDRDFDVMGWHDATVHAMAVDWDPVVLEGGWHGATLLLDLDYIVSWRRGPDAPLRFEVAPATLAFEDAWRIEGDRFELRFDARGFSQHFRSGPIATGNLQSLTSAQRGGPSFARPTAF